MLKIIQLIERFESANPLFLITKYRPMARGHAPSNELTAQIVWISYMVTMTGHL